MSFSRLAGSLSLFVLAEQPAMTVARKIMEIRKGRMGLFSVDNNGLPFVAASGNIGSRSRTNMTAVDPLAWNRHNF